MRTQQCVLVLTLGVGLGSLLCGPGAHAAEGLQLSNPDHAWPQWQARWVVADRPLSWSANLADARPPTPSATLAGDRYFDIGRLGDGGGLRATGALAIGSSGLALRAPNGPSSVSRSLAAPPNVTSRGADAGESLASPYVGMGYSAWWSRSNLGLSADLGVLGQSRGANPWGRNERTLSSNDKQADSARSLQWAPVLQVHLSYAF